MYRAQTSGKGRDAGRELVGELARIVVRQVAPEELELLGETEADYFRDPRLVLKGAQEEAVGFGLDMALLTPYVLVMGSAIVNFLATTVCGAVLRGGQRACLSGGNEPGLVGDDDKLRAVPRG